MDRQGWFHEVDAARSVVHLNSHRIGMQERIGLADPINVDLTDRAEAQLEVGLQALDELRYSDAYAALQEATALSMRCYHEVRTAVSDAVDGTLLYLFLLVPFCVFAERLLVGAADLRKRILAALAFFVLGFLIIRYTHPAYTLVKSPLIVLIGFVIFALCVMILVFISGRFAERIAAVRRAGGGLVESEGTSRAALRRRPPSVWASTACASGWCARGTRSRR